MKIVVIGGGVIGAMTALECIDAGAEVTLVERDRVGNGATAAAGGILVPLYPWQCSSAVNQLLQISQRHWQKWLAVSHNPTLPAAGLLCLDQEQYLSAENWAQQNGWSYQYCDGDKINNLSPELSAADGFLLEDVWQVETSLLIETLQQQLTESSVNLVEHVAAEQIVVRQHQAVGVQTADRLLEADCVVLCAGAWSAALCQHLPVYPVRGQMIEYSYSTTHSCPVILAEGYYLIPRAERLLVGSTVEDSGFDCAITLAARQQLSAFAARYLPSLKTQSVDRQWAGLRPGIARAEPLLGWHPEVNNLFLNTGHHRAGIALAPGSAWLAAQQIVGRAVEVNMQEFALTVTKNQLK